MIKGISIIAFGLATIPALGGELTFAIFMVMTGLAVIMDK